MSSPYFGKSAIPYSNQGGGSRLRQGGALRTSNKHQTSESCQVRVGQAVVR
jgi:hypothetical protein